MNITPEDRENKIEIGMEVLVSEEDDSVYVKFTGFESIEEADAYAEYLHETLPFLLYESGKRH